jgi:hypothetical protein
MGTAFDWDAAMRQDAMLWTGILTGPIVWFAHLQASYTFASLTCSTHHKLSLYLVSIAALLCTVVAASISWRQWRNVEPERPPNTGAVADRRRSMAIGGAGLSVLFFAVILAQTIANVLPMECG